ncbi:MAG: hypothetical protein AAF719_04975 [Pseudomonadota bacterium]
MDRADLLMQIYDEQTNHARHHESLRVNIVSVILTLGSLVIAVICHDGGIFRDDIPIIVFLGCLGLFGYIASMKHYERNRLHVARAQVMREMAEDSLGADDIGDALRKAGKEHEKAYSFQSGYIRLKYVWAIAPLLLSLAAIGLGVIASFSEHDDEEVELGRQLELSPPELEAVCAIKPA